MDEHVFISYARADRGYAAKLAEQWEAGGLKAWYDHEIIPGEQWDQAIERQIVDCVAMLVVITDAARASRWVAREITLAEKKNKLIVPLLRSGEMWWRLDSTQYIDVRDGSIPDPAAVRKAIRDNQRAKNLPRRPQRLDQGGGPQVGAGRRWWEKRRTWLVVALAVCLIAAVATAATLFTPDDPQPSPVIPAALGPLQAIDNTCVEARSFEERYQGAIVLTGCSGQPNQKFHAIRIGNPAEYKLQFEGQDSCLVALTSMSVGTENCAAAATWQFSGINSDYSESSSWQIRYTKAGIDNCLTLPPDTPDPHPVVMAECGRVGNTQQWWIKHPARWTPDPD